MAMARETTDEGAISLVFAAELSLPYPADPETKKAIGAKEMTAAELKKKIDQASRCW
jgi:hypothetical protein